MRQFVMPVLLGAALVSMSGCIVAAGSGPYASHPELAYLSLGRGETVKANLGDRLNHKMGSTVQLKVLGLEQARNLADLENTASQTAQETTGGELGRLMGQLADVASESRSELVLTVVIAGGDAEKGSGQIAHVYSPQQAHGSILGFKVGNKMKATVTATDFKPKVLFVEKYDDRGALGKMGSPTTSAPKYRVVGETEGDGLIPGQASVIYAAGKTSADKNQRGGIFIMVTSEDGKGVTGNYTLKYEVL
jgi:hypothetical protein